MTTQSQKTQQNGYFNLHTSGIAYLSDIREVTPKKGNPFLACRIAALVGESSSPEYRYFDVNVVGEANEKLIRKCQQAVTDKRKVLISFVMADMWLDTFTYSADTKNHKKGETGFSLKGRLINIKMIKVDGELKYVAPKQANENVASDENQVASSEE